MHIIFHKPITIYMGGLILGVNTLYRVFSFFKPFIIGGKELKKQKSLYNVLTPSIKSPIYILMALWETMCTFGYIGCTGLTDLRCKPVWQFCTVVASLPLSARLHGTFVQLPA